MELQGCVSQGETLDELVKNIREAAQLCVEVYAEDSSDKSRDFTRFVGVQEMEVM